MRLASPIVGYVVGCGWRAGPAYVADFVHETSVRRVHGGERIERPSAQSDGVGSSRLGLEPPTVS